FPWLGVLPVQAVGWSARYVFDRAHNVLLDELVTEGLVGASLRVLLVGALLAVGIMRIRSSVAAGEMTRRIGALGAVLAHLADGQLGIATSMSLALFWLAAALLTAPAWADSADSGRTVVAPRQLGTRWVSSVIVAALATALVGWISTRWLLASVAYADGTRHAMAGRMTDADQNFRRSITLARWLPLPAEASANAALRLAASETDPSRRLGLLHQADAALVRARGYAMSGAASWALTGQVALAEGRAGERSRLPISRDAFAAAVRLRRGDANLLAQWGWACL